MQGRGCHPCLPGCPNLLPSTRSYVSVPMSSHHTNPRALLNDATRSLIERVHRAGRPPMAAMTPAQAREFYNNGGPMLDLQPAPHVDRVEDIRIPARDGHAMPARLYAPKQMPGDTGLPVLLYIHGGGFTVGSLTTHDVLCRQLSRQGHCAVVSLDYRLAPEHRFPTAVHDSSDALTWLQQMQAERANAELKTVLGEVFTRKLANLLAEQWFESKPMKQYTPAELAHIAEKLANWQVVPAGTEGYRTAEVTLGGVDTREVSSKTMESLKSPGLYFIGEVLDVTGHLGGFNFQWAWASAYAAGQFA